MQTRHLTYISLALVSLGMAGCTLMGPEKQPSQHTYNLKAPAYHSHRAHTRPITLMVNTPTASSGYQSKKMIYNQKNYELSTFARNVWAGAPADMLKPIILQSLRNTGYFHAVIGTPVSARRNLRLKVNLIELRQDFTLCPSQVKMSLSAALIADQSDRVINSRVFATQVTAPQETPYGGVIAANKATAILMRQLSEFCVDNIAHSQRTAHRSHNKKTPINLPVPSV